MLLGVLCLELHRTSLSWVAPVLSVSSCLGALCLELPQSTNRTSVHQPCGTVAAFENRLNIYRKSIAVVATIDFRVDDRPYNGGREAGCLKIVWPHIGLIDYYNNVVVKHNCANSTNYCTLFFPFPPLVVLDGRTCPLPPQT